MYEVFTITGQIFRILGELFRELRRPCARPFEPDLVNTSGGKQFWGIFDNYINS